MSTYLVLRSKKMATYLLLNSQNDLTKLQNSKKYLPKKTILAPLDTFFRKRLYIVFFGKSKTFPKKTILAPMVNIFRKRLYIVFFGDFIFSPKKTILAPHHLDHTGGWISPTF